MDWPEPDPPTVPAHQPMARRTKGLLVGCGVVVVVVIMGVVGVSELSAQHGPADPGGVVLKNLEAIRQAVPVGASVTDDHSVDATWSPGCNQIPGAHAGWVPAYTGIAFSDTAPSGQVIAGIDAAMTKRHWVRNDVRTAPNQGKIAHWTLHLDGRPSADAFAFATPAHSHEWAITATWTPQGNRADGCP